MRIISLLFGYLVVCGGNKPSKYLDLAKRNPILGPFIFIFVSCGYKSFEHWEFEVGVWEWL